MKNFRDRQRGQGMPQYALILALVALVAIVVLALLSLAISRNYGLLAGVFGTRKDVQDTPNHVYFDTNPPQCGITAGHKELYMQFFTDIEPYLTATTENGTIPLTMTANSGYTPDSGIGNWYIEADLPDNVPCPLAVVIQSDPAHGGITVVWNVLQQNWDH